MFAEENKAIVRRFWEAIARGDLSVIDEVAAPDIVVHFAGLPEPVRGLEAWKQLGAAYFAAFPDLQETQEEVLAEGDRVAARVTWRATHRGELMGIAPTGNRVTITGIAIARVTDGKIREIWEVSDALGLMRQLGVVPAPA